ncbi:hypothetical protein PoB_007685800 [Plakobranchus ocellatus]|uniref:Uncharacterized protein n=1 Tax=Plakobranchus ocellatus TaxID=259542 RepID=A0AAV4E159_9GAST|nr:hypothetical protein PoB_007685800 [Plakobranchus ocellatus]
MEMAGTYLQKTTRILHKAFFAPSFRDKGIEDGQRTPGGGRGNHLRERGLSPETASRTAVDRPKWSALASASSARQLKED